jgi:hypothetical protein
VLIYYPLFGFSGSNPNSASTETLLNGALADADSTATSHENSMLTKGRQQLARILDVPAAPISGREAWADQLLPLVQELDRRGITWGWVNGHALQSGKVGAGSLSASNGRFRSILLPNVKTIEQDTLTSLAQLVGANVSIYFAGSLPTEQPGFKDAAQGDLEVKNLVQQALSSGAKQVAFDAIQIGDTLQVQQPVRYLNQTTIKNYRRQLGDGSYIYFFANQNAKLDAVKLQVDPNQPMWWFDAEQGVAWPTDKHGELDLTLSGFESRFLIVGVPLPKTLPLRVADSVALQKAAQKWPLSNWQLTFDSYSEKLTVLPDWRAIPALAHARGPGIYTQHFSLADKKIDARYLLDLGLVQGSALVKVNGREIGRASIPPFIVDVSTALKAGENVIEIELLAPLRNYFVGRALADDPKYAQMKDYANQLVAAGLMGPVAIAEVLAE